MHYLGYVSSAVLLRCGSQSYNTGVYSQRCFIVNAVILSCVVSVVRHGYNGSAGDIAYTNRQREGMKPLNEATTCREVSFVWKIIKRLSPEN